MTFLSIVFWLIALFFLNKAIRAIVSDLLERKLNFYLGLLCLFLSSLIMAFLFLWWAFMTKHIIGNWEMMHWF